MEEREKGERKREELNKRGKKGRDLRLTSSQPVTLQYVGSLSTL